MAHSAKKGGAITLFLIEYPGSDQDYFSITYILVYIFFN